MALRFRKSFKLAPGIRMNVSGSGISYSIGGRGASLTVGQRGTYLNAGIPGTGFSVRERIGEPSRPSTRSSSKVNVSITVGVDDDGTVSFKDEYGHLLDEKVVAVAKKQQGEAIRGLIQDKCNQINAQTEALAQIHLYTPAPFCKPTFQPEEFDTPEPSRPATITLGFFASLFKSRRDRVEEENVQRLESYNAALKQWEASKAQFDRVQEQRRKFLEQEIYRSVDAKAAFLEETLQEIVWPKETLVATEITDAGKRIFIDVDLPGIEEMPRSVASVPQRGYRLSVKEISPTQVQRLYIAHVHGIGFRIIGEIFSCLQDTNEVVLSAFSQTLGSSSGILREEYLYSVRVQREKWCRINFRNLAAVDVVEALAQFDLRRNMSKTGTFKAIEPFTID